MMETLSLSKITIIINPQIMTDWIFKTGSKGFKELLRKLFTWMKVEKKTKFAKMSERNLIYPKRWAFTRSILKPSGKMISPERGKFSYGAVKIFCEKSWMLPNLRQ